MTAKAAKQQEERENRDREASFSYITGNFGLTSCQSARKAIFLKVDEEIKEAFLGYSMVPFGTWPGKFSVGSLNPRFPKNSQIRKITERVQLCGLLNDRPEHALICLIAEDRVKKSSMSKSDTGPYPTFEVELPFTAASTNLDIIAGQHRIIFLTGVRYVNAINYRNQILAKVKDTSLTFSQTAKHKLELEVATTALQECSWLVAFYDIGMNQQNNNGDHR
jgi:hypothetical protein